MRINHNIAALNTYRQLSGNVGNTGKSLEKLSSGLRINKAGDDAAGLAISEKMRAQIRGLDQATRNASDAISLIQTAEGALTETHSILQRMRELAVQSATDTNTTEDRKEIQKELNNLIEEVKRIADKTEFNKQTLLDGSYGSVTNAKSFHIGANSAQTLQASIADMTADALGGEKASATKTVGGKGVTFTAGVAGTAGNSLTVEVALDAGNTGIVVGKAGNAITITIGADVANVSADALNEKLKAFDGSNPPSIRASFEGTVTRAALVDAAAFGDGAKPLGGGSGTALSALKIADSAATGGVVTRGDADAAIVVIDKAISQVSSERAKLGGVQNRLEHTINNLGATSENLAASESRIRDVDMAKEMMEFTKNNILSQASQAMLAQANMQPQSVLQLLQ